MKKRYAMTQYKMSIMGREMTVPQWKSAMRYQGVSTESINRLAQQAWVLSRECGENEANYREGDYLPFEVVLEANLENAMNGDDMEV